MTITVVLNEDELAGYKAREEAHEQLKSDFQDLVLQYGRQTEVIEKIKAFLRNRCEGNEYMMVAVNEMLKSIGVAKSDYTDWVGEWEEKDA